MLKKQQHKKGIANLSGFSALKHFAFVLTFVQAELSSNALAPTGVPKGLCYDVEDPLMPTFGYTILDCEAIHYHE